MNTVLIANTEWMEEFLLPVFVCVVLPCVIVWLTTRTRRHELDRKTELALKAIESGAQIDPNFFSKAKPAKTVKERIFCRLTTGCTLSALGIAFFGVALFGKDAITSSFYVPLGGGILLLLGIAFIVTYFIGRKQFAAEIAAEEAKIGKE